MFMTDDKKGELENEEEEEEAGDKFKNIFNVKLKKVARKEEAKKPRQNSGISFRGLLKKTGRNKYLEEARVLQLQ